MNGIIYFITTFVLCLIRVSNCIEYVVSDKITALDLNADDRTILIGHDKNLVTYLSENLTTNAKFEVGLETYTQRVFFQEKFVSNQVTKVTFLQNFETEDAILVCLEHGMCKLLDLVSNTTLNISGSINHYTEGSNVYNDKDYVLLARSVDLTKRILKPEDAFIFSVHRLFRSNTTNTQDSNLVHRYKIYPNVKFEIIYEFKAKGNVYFLASYKRPNFPESYCIIVLNATNPHNLKLLEITIRVDNAWRIKAAGLLSTSPTMETFYFICNHREDMTAIQTYRVSMEKLDFKVTEVYKNCIDEKDGFSPNWIDLNIQGMKGHMLCRSMVSFRHLCEIIF